MINGVGNRFDSLRHFKLKLLMYADIFEGPSGVRRGSQVCGRQFGMSFVHLGKGQLKNDVTIIFLVVSV